MWAAEPIGQFSGGEEIDLEGFAQLGRGEDGFPVMFDRGGQDRDRDRIRRDLRFDQGRGERPGGRQIGDQQGHPSMRRKLALELFPRCSVADNADDLGATLQAAQHEIASKAATDAGDQGALPTEIRLCIERHIRRKAGPLPTQPRQAEREIDAKTENRTERANACTKA